MQQQQEMALTQQAAQLESVNQKREQTAAQMLQQGM
jgi:hypothetical protein